jgi:hypothetical protein
MTVGADQLFSLHTSLHLSSSISRYDGRPCTSPSLPLLQSAAGSVPGCAAGTRRGEDHEERSPPAGHRRALGFRALRSIWVSTTRAGECVDEWTFENDSVHLAEKASSSGDCELDMSGLESDANRFAADVHRAFNGESVPSITLAKSHLR